MRTNLPVTGKEVMLKDGEIIVSKTNLKGQITYINQTFLDISGFTEQELIGEPHNIVRHPDMPAEAFDDLWRDLKAGRPWVGYVKNRCKNGDHYWVQAHAVPILENGTVTGYMSVRTAASRQAVDECETAYRLFRDKKQGSARIEHGQVVRGGGMKKRVADASLKVKIGLAMVLMAVLLIVVGVAGVVGMGHTNEGLRDVYANHMQGLADVTQINRTVLRNRILVEGMLIDGSAENVARSGEEMKANVDLIGQTADAYKARIVDPEVTRLFDAFAASRAVFVKEGLLAVVDRVKAGKPDEARKLFAERTQPLNAKVAEDVNALRKFHVDGAKDDYAQSSAEYQSTRAFVIAAVVVALLLAALATVLLLRIILRPLGQASSVFEKIGEGRYGNALDVSCNDEIGKVLQSLEIMQTKLGFDVAETRRVSDENLRIKIALDNVSTGVMIANRDREIIYVNNSVQRILKNAEPELKKALPTFNADKLVGESIDQFHKNPKHQADLLGNLKTTYVANLNIGSLHMRVTASPVLNERGDRLGAVAEWLDRTPEVMVEQEVENLIAAAGQGNFDTRLTLEGKDGFFRKLSEGLNKLSETVSIGLNDVARVLKSIAQGDLTQSIDGQYEGIFGELKDDTNTTIERLREVVGQIKEATDLINTAAKEIAAGNTDLSSRTEEQASSLEETASSMEELNSTVKQNAENASQANQLARNSNDTAVKSGQMVQQIVSTMNGISESSRKIADIIGVIDSIAFQTNILALNAAVEAARAGEQGRGFAVVATEVRNLAQRSATAAKEIKELIAESTGKVDAGTKLVDEAGDSMEAVVASFQQVTGLVTDIANASREQASGIEQVTQAVGQMDEVTQQNAALVEEAAAAAESLEEQARALVQAVSMFKLDGNAARATTTLPGPALRDATPRSLPPGKAAPKTAIAKPRPLPPVTEGEDEWEEF